MKHNPRILIAIFFIFTPVLSACAIDRGTGMTSEEESGVELSLDETYDTIRNGARLVLTYDAESNSFIGFVENTTDKPLKQVRVEVHLSNGVELGPTTATDLSPGERIEIILKATNRDFDGWTAHPEVGERGGGEHGSGEGEDEHSGEGEGEYDVGGSD
jgi:hypothetical protein